MGGGFAKPIPDFFTKSIPSRRLSARMVLGRIPCPPLVEATRPRLEPFFQSGPLNWVPSTDISHRWDGMMFLCALRNAISYCHHP